MRKVDAEMTISIGTISPRERDVTPIWTLTSRYEQKHGKTCGCYSVRKGRCSMQVLLAWCSRLVTRFMDCRFANMIGHCNRLSNLHFEKAALFIPKCIQKMCRSSYLQKGVQIDSLVVRNMFIAFPELSQSVL